MTKAMRHAEVAPDEVDYIVAHGTSTQLNDVTETRAIKAAYGEHAYKVAISSPKSMIGHLVGAAGVASVLAGIGAIRDQVIPPTANLHTPGPRVRPRLRAAHRAPGEGRHGRRRRLRLRRPERGGDPPARHRLTDRPRPRRMLPGRRDADSASARSAGDGRTRWTSRLRRP